MACPVLRERSPAVDAREGTETAHFPAKICYTTPRDAIDFKELAADRYPPPSREFTELAPLPYKERRQLGAFVLMILSTSCAGGQPSKASMLAIAPKRARSAFVATGKPATAEAGAELRCLGIRG
jgi:hypothetical protein